MCRYTESRCGLECPPHGKADCAYTSTVIGDLTAKSLLNRAAKKKKSLLESCGINMLRAASCIELYSAVVCVDLRGLLSVIFKLRQSLFSELLLLHTTSEHETARIYSHVFWCSCVGTIAPQIQSHMVSVCAANYLQQKEFQDCYEPFLYLVSSFIPMISFTVRLSLWHSSYMVLIGKSSVFKYENMERAGAINKNVNSGRIHLFYSRSQKVFFRFTETRLHCSWTFMQDNLSMCQWNVHTSLCFYRG